MKYLILLFSLLTIINGDVRRLLQTNTVCPTGEKLNPNGECRQICGGIAVLTCPNGYRCADDPTDTCNPKDNDADCSGFCESVCPTGEILNPNGVCAQICGGIAGLTCPNGYTCIDDPRDTCDPKNNGADCSGFCESVCPTGEILNPNGVCAQICGGIAGLTCPDRYTCVDDPRDTCDPKNNGADCSGFCESVCPTGEILNPNGVCAQICGGIAGLTCPDRYTCVDDPRDTCDPKNNGVDCSGFCHETPTCTDGTTTCTCDKSTCEPCNRLDGTGKGICSCRCDNTGAC
eukprot:79579_1